MELLTSIMLDVLADLVMLGQNEEVEPALRIEVKAVINTFVFHATRLQEKKREIKELLNELPDNFQFGKGGGWSFLNMCETKYGVQWTDLHLQMELLCCMAIATKQGRFMFDRELWSALPGGMPYFVVEDYE